MAHTAERSAEAKRFQAFLKSRSQQVEEGETALVAVLKAENEKAWAQKEAVWAGNRRAKDKLAKQVAEGRSQQVQSRIEKLRQFELEKEHDKQALAEKDARLLLAEQQKAQKKQAIVDAYRGELVSDIAAKSRIQKAAVEELVQERKVMAEQYQQFDENLNAVMGAKYQPPLHYRKKKVQWYF